MWENLPGHLPKACSDDDHSPSPTSSKTQEGAFPHRKTHKNQEHKELTMEIEEEMIINLR